MRVDVSEIKTFRACKRQWQLSSRNQFHLRPRVPAPALAMGTIFHEALAQLYLGASLDKVMEMVQREMNPETDQALLAMIPGYYYEVLPHDLERYKPLDVEHHFEIAPTTAEGEYLFPVEHKTDPKTGELLYDENGEPVMVSSLTICGSIDLVCLDVEQNKIYGFEHKTCKNFRDSTYLWMDEQPRVYTWALKHYVDEYNRRKHDEYLKALERYNSLSALEQELCARPVEPEPAALGGVYLNEVKKLLRKFQYSRTLCKYTSEDLNNFMQAFYESCYQCKHAVEYGEFATPQPSYFACSMCNFNTICTTYMYNNLDKDEIVDEFCEEFAVREEDHLDEKAERSADSGK